MKTQEQIAIERLETRRDEITELLPFQERETQRMEIRTEIDAIDTLIKATAELRAR